MKRIFKISIFSISLLFMFSFWPVYSQNNEPPKMYKTQTFRNTRFVNAPTIKALPKGGFEFNIQHRFGFIDYDENVLDDFFGLDLSSNIRLGFAVPVHKRVYVGVGRTKFNKQYDFEVNAVLMKQTMDNKQPVTIAIYHNTAYMSNDFPKNTDNLYNADSTKFSYKTSHRFSYYTQLSIASQLNNRISIQLAPAVTYKNLAPKEFSSNWIFSLPTAVRLKTAMLSSVLLEAAPVFGNMPTNYMLPLAIAYEIKTVSHVFQITASNSNHILNQDLYFSNCSNPFKEGFYLGFNMHKFFNTKK